jgi:hypothetical protein
MKRVRLRHLVALSAFVQSMAPADAKAARFALNHKWAVYGSQRSRYEKQARRSQRQKRKANRRAYPHGFNGRAAA